MTRILKLMPLASGPFVLSETTAVFTMAILIPYAAMKGGN